MRATKTTRPQKEFMEPQQSFGFWVARAADRANIWTGGAERMHQAHRCKHTHIETKNKCERRRDVCDWSCSVCRAAEHLSARGGGGRSCYIYLLRTYVCAKLCVLFECWVRRAACINKVTAHRASGTQFFSEWAACRRAVTKYLCRSRWIWMDGWADGRTEGSVKNDQQPKPAYIYTSTAAFYRQAGCAKNERWETAAAGLGKKASIASSQNRWVYTDVREKRKRTSRNLSQAHT